MCYIILEKITDSAARWCRTYGYEHLNVYANEEFESLIDTLVALKRILKNHKSSLLEIPEEHQNELDLRLERYRKNPQDLLDWEDIKNVW